MRKRMLGWLTAVVLVVCLLSVTALAATIDSGKSGEQLVESLLGDGITAENVVGSGSLSFISGAMSDLGISDGVMLDTNSGSETQDAQLAELISAEGKSYGGHTSLLQFELTANGTLLNFNYIFASREFNQPSTFNDIFGLFVKVNDGEWENIARLDNGRHITITNLRAGRDGTQLDSGSGTSISSGTSYDYFTAKTITSLNRDGSYCNGVSNVFNAQKEVEIGDRVTVKFVIADVGDSAYNSYVVIEAGSLSFAPSSAVDYTNEVLQDLEPGKTYAITADGITYTIIAGAKGTIPLAGSDSNGVEYDFIGKTISIVQKADNAGGTDSEAQEVEISTRPSAPDAPTVSDESALYEKPEDVAETDITTTLTSVTINGKEGQEYRVDNGEWVMPGADGKVVIDGLGSGASVVIYTRWAATDSAPASESSDGTTVTLADPLGKLNLTVIPYIGDFDGLPHGVTVTSAEGATITYSTQPNSVYTDENPTFTEGGQYIVYYRAAKEGYEPVYGQTTVTIKLIMRYDANGADSGTVPTDYNSYLPGSDAVVKSNAYGLFRAGYIFMGWSTDPEGNGTIYEAGDILQLAANTTLYAVWQEIEKTTLTGSVTFNYSYSYTVAGGSIQSGTQNEGERATKVKVTLLKGGIAVGEPVIVDAVMSGDQAVGTYEFTNVPVTDEQGSYLNYTVRAVALREDGTETHDYAVSSAGYYHVELNYSPECFDAQWKVTVTEWDESYPIPDSIFVKVLYATDADAAVEEYRVITQQVSGSGTECGKVENAGVLTYSGSYPVWKYQAGAGGSYYHKFQIVGYSLNGVYVDMTDEGVICSGEMVYVESENAGSEVMELSYRNTLIPTVEVGGDILIKYSYSYTLSDGSIQSGTQNMAERATTVRMELLCDGEVIDSQTVVLGVTGNRAAGSYSFGHLQKYSGTGVHAYTVRASALNNELEAVSDYSVDIAMFDAVLTYSPRCFDAAWSVTLDESVTGDKIPTSINVKVLYATEPGAPLEEYEIISQQANNLGTECFAVTENGVTSYTGSYPVWQYQANEARKSYYHKIQVVGYTVDGVYHDVSHRDLISDGEMYFDGNGASGVMEHTLLPEIPEETVTVSGKVLDAEQVGVRGAVVQLCKGSEVIATTTTDIYGHYSFVDVEDGDYNIVVTYTDGVGEDAVQKVMTQLVSVNYAAGDAPDITMVMPAGNVSSVVEIDETEAAGEKMDPSGTLVDGVDKIVENVATPAPESQITVKLVISAKEDVTESEDAAHETVKEEQSAIKEEAKGKVVEFVDLTLTQTTTDGSGNSTTNDIGDSNTVLLTIIIPFDTESVEDIVVYRYHGSAVEVMTENPAAGEEGFVVGDGIITVYAKKFSTYGIGYTQRRAANTGAVYIVSNPPVENGKVTVSTWIGYSGTPITVTVTPDEGYELAELGLVDNFGNPLKLTAKKDGTYYFFIPDRNVNVVASFRAVEKICLRDESCPISGYADAAPSQWYHDGVHYCIEQGLMSGFPDSLFVPGGTTTRAQIVTTLWRLAGEPVVNYAMRFEDVHGEQWYTEAIRWAAAEGIVDGYSEVRFAPNDPITREQMACILYRYCLYNGIDVSAGADTDLIGYTDAAEVSDWAVEAMRWACGAGLIDGIADGAGMKLDPSGSATRAQVATLLWRFCEAWLAE